MPAPIIRFLFLGDPRTDRRLKNFMTIFAEFGFRTELIFASPHAHNEQFSSSTTVTELHLKNSGGVKMFLEYHTLLEKELAKSQPCDILFACELYSLKAAVKAKQEGKGGKLFYDARELYTELPTVATSPIKKYFWKRWERRGLRQSDLVIVTAPDDAPAIKQVHGFLPQSVVIRNLPMRENLQRNNYLREYFHIANDKKIFVYVGGLQKDRGLEKMITAMATLKDNAAFVMIGNGVLKNSLETTSQRFNNIYFHPEIDSDKVISVLSSADIGVSLIEQHSISYQLALPSKIFEYMLAGLPVISSPLKQVQEIFSGTKGIIFVDPEDQTELIDGCRKAQLLSDDNELKDSLHSDIFNNFTFEAEAKAIKKYLDNYM
jgi:glycosyltransferase involved in cell wall biosynthesis